MIALKLLFGIQNLQPWHWPIAAVIDCGLIATYLGAFLLIQWLAEDCELIEGTIFQFLAGTACTIISMLSIMLVLPALALISAPLFLPVLALGFLGYSLILIAKRIKSSQSAWRTA